ncbi:MAG TPA: type I glyceraldehyde-3-phosphate dehydrogenase [Deltaproteobacteria bacterium]|nr:MAG: type I glyceraldehyde-3-phosphate dehydrogenase [Deltaproteobacteria bacterium GWA2_45_12]HBF13225.1 type I glyceraldehyde-3-phosphate dehydrogenase [Deltaproteobacteria bacterium]
MIFKIGINGFGRIGRCIARALLTQKLPFQLVLLNELADVKTNAHLLKYDSVHGQLPLEVSTKNNSLIAGNHEIRLTAEKDPSKIPWKDMGVDIVLECTGLFTDKEKASLHLAGGAKKVLVSAPSKNPDITLAYGINMNQYDPKNHHIVSNASCTTNCLAPVAKVLHENFGIERGLVTTIHSYTNDQRILDVAHSDLRRARAGAISQIPTKTGAAQAVGLVLPALKGKIDGFAIRVPTPNVSCVDLVCTVSKAASKDNINQALKEAADKSLKGVLSYTDEELVSIDFNGNKHSAIVDGLSTKTIENKLIKVLAWYDNETGFSNRMLDVARYMAERL